MRGKKEGTRYRQGRGNTPLFVCLYSTGVGKVPRYGMEGRRMWEMSLRNHLQVSVEASQVLVGTKAS